jgi:periodic tryptophan protein 1
MYETWLVVPVSPAAAASGGEANIYVHHDILLPALPLSLAWMNMRPAAADAQDKANMVAVGTMDPGIEIWDLDIADQVEPAATLGGYGPLTAAADEAAELAQEADNSSSKAAKKKIKAKAKKAAKRALAERPLKAGSHLDAVLGLSWNAEYRNVLASGSADSTVKVWDVSTCSCAHTLSHHSDKVQAVAWNPAESPVLLTGSFDKTTCLVSSRERRAWVECIQQRKVQPTA